MKSFLVELVSNGSMDVYSDNTLSSFSNFLPEQINLVGEWEVALLEITYPAQYNNITEGKVAYKHYTQHATTTQITIPKGFYKSLAGLIKTVNYEVNEKTPEGSMFDISYDQFSGKIKFSFDNEDTVLCLVSNDIANIFGYPNDTTFISSELNTESPLPADIARIHTVMVYTDIVEHGIIGDARAPLLRSFPFIHKFKFGELEINQSLRFQSFDQLQFRKVLKNSFHSIKIDLRTAAGELIPFKGIGNTRLTLLFRQLPSDPVTKHY